AKAQQAASDGDYSRAIRFLHLAGVIRLDSNGHITFDASSTNSEYLRKLVLVDPKCGTLFGDLSRAAEAATFGHVTVDADSFLQAERGWSDLEECLINPGTRR